MPAKIESFYTDVGSLIRDRRTKAGMTQEDLGQRLSPPTSRVSVANVERGVQRVLSHTLVQFADALNVEVTELLPQKSGQSTAVNSSRITDELVAKLGITVNEANELTAQTRKP